MKPHGPSYFLKFLYFKNQIILIAILTQVEEQNTYFTTAITYNTCISQHIVHC